MNPEAQKLVLAGKLPAADGEKLSTLEPGTFVLHKSWGVGRMSEWDLLGDRLIIDFEGKPGHPLKLSFAISSLEVLPADHILSRRLADLPGLQQMAKDQPAALVEDALKWSGGKMSLDQLDTILKGRIVPDGEYKKWWEGAKRALKPVRYIVVPAKRTEPLILREKDENPATALVENFVRARDMKGKLAALAAIAKDVDLFANPAVEIVPALRNLSETVGKAFRLHLKECLNLLLSRDELVENIKGELPAGSLKVADIVRESKPQIPEAVNSLPVGQLGRLYRSFPIAFPDRQWVPELLQHLTRTGGRAVAEIATVLDENDELPSLAEFLKKAVRNRVLSTDLLIWLAKERSGLACSVFDIDLGHAILGALEDDHVKGGSKKTGRLQEMVNADRDLLGQLVADADEDEVRLFAKRLLASNVFDELTRRSLMARIIKARPEMEALMAEGAVARQDEALIVSWDSLEKKKQELEDIINVKIPQNKRDIQIAREYGDLRENFEYKSAKQQQAVLLRMQAKYERELRHARGTDFAEVPTDKAGIGTIVEIEDLANGARDTYTILGAWDGDVEKNIIAYLSETAKALIGKAPGEEVDVPSDTSHAGRKVRVVSVTAYNAMPAA
ncbi:MAG: GreA/GreB family elongation factor [Verrucomicrobiaceae bacterium]|nr:GreA/GreB family elongation factor [Verrucomicrobiaceae bacterium]